MNRLSQTARAVNLNLPTDTHAPYNPTAGASIVKWYKHFDETAKRTVILSALYSNGVAQNNRTRGGKMYANESLYVRCDHLEELLTAGAHTFVIRIEFKRSGRTLFYSAPIETIKELGNREYTYGCWQWGLPVRYWSVNGQEPEAAQPEPEPTPQAEQPALFDFAEAEPVSRWGGGY